jgi:eukaryotic-like serine/threonine-protein kinase
VQLVPGQVVATKLRLVRQLGAGGMGSVWVADHLTLRTQVAVKFMAAALAGNVEALGRFAREAAAAARIKSPHVARVFDFGVWEQTPYMVLELLAGEDLAAQLRRRGALDPVETAQIIDQVARVLEEAHEQGIVHRDIKPANVFLTPSGGEVFVKLLDFGVAKAQGLEFSMKTETGAALGTPYYMGPEQLFSRGSIDARMDLWSLAVVAYECLTGDVPFRGETIAALGVAIHGGVFRPPSAFGRLSSPALDGWFARALARDPDARFRTARELAESFRGVAGTVAPPLGRSMQSSSGASSAETAQLGPTLLAATAPAPGRRPPPRGAPVVVGAMAAVVLGGAGMAAWHRAGSAPGRAGDGDTTVAALPPATAPIPEVSASASPSVEPVVEAMSAPPASSVAPAASASAAPSRPAPGRAAGPTGPAKPRRRDHGF